MVTKTLTKTLASCALGLSLLAGLAADAAETAPAPEKPVIEMAPYNVSAIGRHFIVTLHGVRGNADSYANFHQIIRDHLRMIDPAYRPITINFRYQVGKEGFDPFSVADKLNKEIEKALVQSADPNLHFPTTITDNDKISVIGYSMGGQVGYAWFEETYNHPSKPEYKDYLKHMDLFFSMGGTYWGTHFSQIGVDLSSIASSIAEGLDAGNDSTTEDGFIDRQFKSLFAFMAKHLTLPGQLEAVHLGGTSGSEIANLSDLSSVTQKLRAFRMQQARGLPGINPRWISLMGVFPCAFDGDTQTPGCQPYPFDTLRSWTSPIATPKAKLATRANTDFVLKRLGGGIRLEADGPVPVPNANFNFFFAQDLNPNYSENDVLSNFSGSQVGSAKTPLLEEVIHATLDGGKYVNDMVIVLDKCKVAKTCDNPVYRHLLKALANCERENSTCLPGAKNFIQQFYAQFAPMSTQETNLTNEMREFSLDLNIRLPDDYQVRDDLRKKFENKPLAQQTANWKTEKAKDEFESAKNEFNYLVENGDNRKLLDYVKFTPGSAVGLFKTDVIKTDSSAPYVVQIARKTEALSVSFRYVEKDTTGHQALIASIKGYISPKDVQNSMDLGSSAYLKAKNAGTYIPFEIALPELKTRKIRAFVKPTYSTYVDVQMAR